jgi:hypothetical protein
VSKLLAPPQARALETSLIQQALGEGRVIYNIAERSIAAGVPVAEGLFQVPTASLLNPGVYW